MQSYKIYCQKSSVIVPDKWIKITEILWHIFNEYIYIFLQNLEWQFVHQTGGIQVGANQAEPISLTFVDGNLREAEYNSNFDFGAQHYRGRWDRFQKFGLLGQITFIPPGEVENFTKSVKDKLYEKWGKFLEILKKIRVKLPWCTNVFEEGFWGTSSGCWEIWFSISPWPKKNKKISKIVMKFFYNFFKISRSLLYHFFKVLQNFEKLFQNFFLSATIFPKIRAMFL